MSHRDLSRTTQKLHFTFSDLSLSYDATLKALSNALDLRDGEAKGHTERVTQWTISLAKAFMVDNASLDHIQRGALLHDVGNLFVPENILHKQDMLTADEWVTIHMHPFYAYEMLEPIAYLRPALDIPFRHHEKWDGTGYPRSLKGEEIPLPARIFAVVDVFDALTSDRPYRKAWPKAKAMDFIREQAGKHFDPNVVIKFVDRAPVL